MLKTTLTILLAATAVFILITIQVPSTRNWTVPVIVALGGISTFITIGSVAGKK